MVDGNMILFSQSASDIQYILSLYERYKNEKDIKIYIVNVENNYKFLKSLDLKAKLEFIPIVAQKKIFKYIWFSFKLRFLYRKLFSDTRQAKIYFFSDNYDYVTSFFIEKLYQDNEVYFIDIYKQNFSEKKSTLNNIKKAIMYCLLGIQVYFNEYSYIYILNNKIKKINMTVKQDDIEKYKYKVICENSHKNNLLLYESNSGSDKWFVDYNRDLANIINKVSNDYNIYVKPHPRFGYSKFLEKYSVTIISDYIPSELLTAS